MQRQLWVLLGWSPEYGTAITPVAVLGLDIEASSTFVEWLPRVYDAGCVWRERITTTPPEKLLERMVFWENTPVAAAARVDPLLPSADLADEVRAQVDDIVGSAR